jgi:hypothetical protein
MEGHRFRRISDPHRQFWYALYRQMRFIRRYMGTSLPTLQEMRIRVTVFHQNRIDNEDYDEASQL